MLITYPDALGKNLKEMEQVLTTYFPGVIGGLHVLPFYPSSGDRGFAVISYDQVDPSFGTWEDIDRLADKYYVMADFMPNHISIRSREFQDYMQRGEKSPYKDMFIDWYRFWGGKPSEEDYRLLLKRSIKPYQDFLRADGKTVRLWKTFFSEQIDVDFSAEYVQLNLNGAILFDSGKADLVADARPIVDKIGRILQRFEKHIIEVEGHTDNVPIGSNKYESNEVLSVYRALAVTKRLRKNTNLDPKYIKFAGRGDYVPVADNSTPEGRARNRRVEIKVYNSYNSDVIE